MNRDAAWRYAGRGRPVIPLRPNSKLPLTRHGSRDATIDPHQIARWWARWPDANVGLATGNGLLVVDLDGEQGAAAWLKLGDRTPTAFAVTASGGLHFYYQAGPWARNSASLLGPNIDTRGRGGYVVAPPSRIDGRAYRWVRPLPAQPCPAWIRDQLAPRTPQPPAPYTPAPGMSRYGEAALTRIHGRLGEVTNGQRNDALNNAAYQAGRLAGAGHLARQDAAPLIDTAVHLGLNEREAARTFDSGFRAGLNDPVPTGRVA